LDGAILDPNLTLDDYKITDGTLLVARMTNKGRIYVSTPHNLRVCINCNEYWTIKDVKMEIEKKGILTAHKQRLIYKGKQLENDKTLIHYRISMCYGQLEGEILHLVPTAHVN
jgi:hypothetical protein